MNHLVIQLVRLLISQHNLWVNQVNLWVNFETITKEAKPGCGAVSLELINYKFFKGPSVLLSYLSLLCLLIRRLKPASCIITVGNHKSWQTASVTLSLSHTEVFLVNLSKHLGNISLAIFFFFCPINLNGVKVHIAETDR